MRVVTAGVHDPWITRTIRDIVLFLDGQCIDVGSERHHRGRWIGRPNDLTNDPATVGLESVRNIRLSQDLADEMGGARFVATQFWMLMKMASKRDELWFRLFQAPI